MVAEASWKRRERQVARLLGGERQPNSGRRWADVIAGAWAVEVKSRRGLPRWLLQAMAQAEDAAKETGRLPLVVLVHAPGRGRKVRCYALLPLEGLTSLVKARGGP